MCLQLYCARKGQQLFCLDLDNSTGQLPYREVDHLNATIVFDSHSTPTCLFVVALQRSDDQDHGAPDVASGILHVWLFDLQSL